MPCRDVRFKSSLYPLSQENSLEQILGKASACFGLLLTVDYTTEGHISG